MAPRLPPLRALQTFAVFGDCQSVAQTAAELGISPGAVSQQLKLLEASLGRSLILRQGRGVALRADAKAYHRMVREGFDSLAAAQALIQQQDAQPELSISALPSLLSKWLNPRLGGFQDHRPGLPVRLEATHTEPDRHLQSTDFRLTYGSAAEQFPHKAQLFRDQLFPVCAPELLDRHPQAADPAALAGLPLIHTDWGPQHPDLPGWADWLAQNGGSSAGVSAGVYSLSSLALEAAAAGQGVALAQGSFAAQDLAAGRLIRLPGVSLEMPHPYFICWGSGALDRSVARDFLNWVRSLASQ